MNIGRSGGWQVILADLALILFVTLAVHWNAGAAVPAAKAGAASLAVWRQSDAAGDLSHWLDAQADDRRAILDLRVTCPLSHASCLDKGLRRTLNADRARFAKLRLTIVPGKVREAEVRLAYE